MNTFIKKFANWASSNLPAEFLATLDQNFKAVSVQYGPYITSTDGYVLRETDTIDSLQVSAAAASLTVYLPSSPTGNRRRRVIKTDSTANTITVSGNGSLINGVATYVLAAQYDKLDVEPTGTGWLIVN